MLDRNIINDVLTEAISTGADFSEIFLEDTFFSNISIGDRKIEAATSGINYGAGIRVTKGYFWSYVTTNDITRKGLLKAAKKAAFALQDYPNRKIIDVVEKKFININPILINPMDVSKKEKISYLEEVSNISYALNSKIKRVDSNITDKVQKVLIANSDGLLVQDKRTYTSFALTVLADDGKEQVDTYEKKARHQGFEMMKNIDIKSFSENVVKNAIEQLSAINCPAGKMPVVLSPNGGVLFHEACGHSLEATALAKGASNFSGMLGKKIASDKITLVDDGTIPNAWGSLNFDDEGNKTQRNVLIEKGISKGYLVDKFNGEKMDMKATGSSRREDYTFFPTSRMNNTFILGGEDKPEDMIKDLKEGLYVTKLGGGSVNTTTGDFNFSVLSAKIIENGKLGKSVKGAKIIGNGGEVLQNIDMVGDDFDLASNGMCGSVSGSVPVGIGQPSLRISSITVGGQK